ncbi:cartilage matrix protein-like isoform X2 [Mytilus edulis]|uniref:cartilage matrix protein-like isoform X2 n=1 Tax=Mytilus edulis TaxID=6550 RepID=UPI0039EF9E7D
MLVLSLFSLLLIARVTARSPPAPTGHPEPPVYRKCLKKIADVFFVVDTSSSLKINSNVIKELDFIDEVITAFDLDKDQMRTGMMTFATNTELLFKLDDFKTKKEIAKILDDRKNFVKYQWKGGDTNIGKALRLLMDGGLSHGSRADVPQIAVIITDGNPNDKADFASALLELRKKNVIVFAIGVGPDRRPDNLRKIAGDPERVFELEDYDSLRTIGKELVDKVCDKEQNDEDKCKKKKDCDGAMADVIFVADSSRSLGYKSFNKLKQFAEAVVKRFTVSPIDIQVGFINFGNDSILEFRLNSYRDQDEVMKAISKVQYLDTAESMQLTYTGKALQMLIQKGFLKQNGGRGGKVPKIAIIITDGEPTDIDATHRLAKEAKQQGIIIFAIGVGQWRKQDEINLLASDPDTTHAFVVENYDSLSFIEAGLAKKTCTAAIQAISKKPRIYS